MKYTKLLRGVLFLMFISGGVCAKTVILPPTEIQSLRAMASGGFVVIPKSQAVIDAGCPDIRFQLNKTTLKESGKDDALSILLLSMAQGLPVKLWHNDTYQTSAKCYGLSVELVSQDN